MKHTLRATSFATRQDLADFCRRVTEGDTVRQALNFGDNGIGAWGDATWRLSGQPIIALPSTIAKHNAEFNVLLPTRPLMLVKAICRDIAPAGVVDLNPAALIAFGYLADADINIPGATVEPA